MLSHTKGQKFILCDHTKIGLDFNYQYCNFNDVDYLITDINADSYTLSEIKENWKIQILQVEPINKDWCIYKIYNKSCGVATPITVSVVFGVLLLCGAML